MGTIITILVLLCATILFTCGLVALILALKRNRNRRSASDYEHGYNTCQIENLNQYNSMLREEIRMLRKTKK